MRQVNSEAGGEAIATRVGRAGRRLWPALVALAFLMGGIAARTAIAASDDTTSPDVYARSLLVRDELELIRLEMGRPKDTRRELRVHGAEPREVFFQALTLFYMVNRLSFDLIRERAELPENPVGTPRLTHVRAVLDALLVQLRRVKAALGSIATSRERPRDAAMTPSDVFSSIVQGTRQVDLLLDRHIDSRDVFQQVTLAVGYAAQLRTRFPGTRMPEAPPFERHKRPVDVYRRLIDCFHRVRTIMTHSGLSALTLDQHPEVVTSNDVYNIAALIVSELSDLHARVDGALPPPAPYDPGRKFPSDVYQRAGLLETLLIDLQARVEASPAWLHTQYERE